MRANITILFLLIGVAALGGTAKSGANHDVVNSSANSTAKSGANHNGFVLVLDIPGRGTVALHLERRNVFKTFTNIQAITDGSTENVDTSSVQCFRGTLPNDPKSVVVITTYSARPDGMGGARMLMGTVIAGTEQFDIQGQCTDTGHVQTITVVRPVVVQTQARACVTQETAISSQVLAALRDKTTESVQAFDTLELQLAIETDYQFYEQSNSDRDRSLAYIAQVVGVTSAIYERDMHVRLDVTNVRLWETADDPYPDEGNIVALREAFVTEYETNMTTLQRDVAVLLSKRLMLGGIAKIVGGVCRTRESYLVADLTGDIGVSGSDFQWDRVVLAHELGHVCGGLHTHSCLWPSGPLDSCVASENGVCVTVERTKPSVGTIMGFCSGRRTEGGGMLMEFHPLSRYAIRAYLERASCVGMRDVQRNCVLGGKLLDAATNTPIANATLSITKHDESIVRTPDLGPVTTSTTSADGSFAFNLAAGVYDVHLPQGWTVLPVEHTSRSWMIPAIVAAESTQLDIRASRTYPVSFKFSTRGDKSSVNMLFASQTLSGQSQNQIIDGEDAAASVVITSWLPAGSYTMVPRAGGRMFTPVRHDFEITDGGSIPEIMFKSEPSEPYNTGAVAAVVSRLVDGFRILTDGDTILATVAGRTHQKLAVGKNGVAVFEGISVDTGCTLRYITDTTTFTHATQSLIEAVPLGTAIPIFEKRDRSFPLVARPYQLQISTAPFEPLTDATRFIEPEAISVNLPMPVYPPFAIRYGGEWLNKLYVYASGDVVLGYRAIRGFVPVLNTTTDAPFVISVLSNNYRPDSSSVHETGVWWKVSGDAPNRKVSFEWRRMRGQWCNASGDCFASGTMTFQLHLEESTGIITMHYGNIVADNATMVTNIGLRGKDLFDARTIVSTGGGGGINWQTPALSDVGMESYNTAFDNTNNPPNGLMYRWVNAATDMHEDETDKAEADANNGFSLINRAFTITSFPSEDLIVRGLEGATVSLIDIMGRTLRTAANIPNVVSWDVGSYAPGRYTLLVEHADRTFTQPVIIVR